MSSQNSWVRAPDRAQGASFLPVIARLSEPAVLMSFRETGELAPKAGPAERGPRRGAEAGWAWFGERLGPVSFFYFRLPPVEWAWYLGQGESSGPFRRGQPMRV